MGLFEDVLALMERRKQAPQQLPPMTPQQLPPNVQQEMARNPELEMRLRMLLQRQQPMPVPPVNATYGTRG
jgi:hypothetical protein